MKEIDITQNNGISFDGTASIEIPWLNNNQKLPSHFTTSKSMLPGRVYEGVLPAIDESGGNHDLEMFTIHRFVGKSEYPSANSWQH